MEATLCKIILETYIFEENINFELDNYNLFFKPKGLILTNLEHFDYWFI